MPSRPTIRTFLTPAHVAAGNSLDVRFELTSTQATKVDFIEVSLEGTESRYRRTVTTGKSTRRTYYRRTQLSLAARFPSTTLEPGTIEHRARFELPPDAPPTFRSALSQIAYSLTVHVSIPWWPDARARYDVVVLPQTYAKASPRPLLVTSNPSESRGKDPLIELSANATVLAPGSPFDASIALTGAGDRTIRRVELALVAIERPLVSSSAGPLEVDRRVWAVREGTPADGEACAMRAVVPPDMVRTFKTPFIAVDHFLEAKAVVAWGSDISLTVPVSVVDLDGPANSAESPSVGRARHRDVWRAASDHLRLPGVTQLSVDADSCEARFTVGAVSAVVCEETHASLGPSVVAELTYADVGLDLRVAERKWSDFGSKVPSLNAAFGKRFSCSIRDPKQALSLLSADVQEAVLLFDEVGISDDRVVALRKGGVYQPSSLQRVLQLVVGLAQRLDIALRRVEPPPVFADCVDVWRAFAAKYNATLRSGDLSVTGWSVRGHSLAIVHSFDGATPRYTTIRASIDRRGSDDADGAALSRATNATVVVREGVVAMRVPLALDPSSCVDAADRLAVALSALLTGASGAYR